MLRFLPVLAVGVPIVALAVGARVVASELIPPATALRHDRPRLLLRPNATAHAISLEQLRTGPRDDEFRRLLSHLQRSPHAAAQALVWQITGDSAAAERALARIESYRYPGQVDTFHIYLRLTELALAYDWLYDYPGFTTQSKAQVRSRVFPLAQQGLKIADDHMFHNYVWMSAGGTALWAMATAGDDQQADALLEQIRQRFNHGLFPAWKYLDGLPSEPMGYWALYVYTPGVLTLLGAQSAYETDLVEQIRQHDGDWLDRHWKNLIHSTLPDLRFVPWGDLQSGPNGGMTHEMAGIVDATTWALRSPQGEFLSRRLQQRRGAARFHGETAIFYMLYGRNRTVPPKTPPRSYLAGNQNGGHFIARSSWDDDATIVALTCTDHFGDHHHYDQGSFLIYRQGLLAVDPPVYRRIRGPQQRTDHHNTLLLDGQPQRPVRGQWFATIDAFQQNLTRGHILETGDILFHTEAEHWTAVACQFAQAYPPGTVKSCVRQLLFVRPSLVVIVDHLDASATRGVPRTQWLLQLPGAPTVQGNSVWASHGTSWLRCQPVVPAGTAPHVSPTDVQTHRVSYEYRPDGKTLTLVHQIEVGEGPGPAEMSEPMTVQRTEAGVEAVIAGQSFVFEDRPPHRVRVRSHQ
jgi:hypothetical protein